MLSLSIADPYSGIKRNVPKKRTEPRSMQSYRIAPSLRKNEQVFSYFFFNLFGFINFNILGFLNIFLQINCYFIKWQRQKKIQKLAG